jgi:hypothetical protein
MTDWVARITKVYDWTNNLDDEEMLTIIRKILVELESTLLDASKEAEDKRQKLWMAIRATASQSPLWPQRRELD